MNPKYTFNPSTRYITRGISEVIPLEIQFLMWNEVDKVVKMEKVDYLQVFEFNVKGNHIEMEHRQEEPEYKQTIHLKKVESYLCLDKVKVFVIDDLDHSTMLLASEY